MSKICTVSARAVPLPLPHPREPYDLFDAIAQHEPGVDPGDQCAADLELCQKLVREQGADPERIDRLFREGPRMRPMWDQAVEGGETYGRRIIAIAVRTEAPRPDAGTCTAGIPAREANAISNIEGNTTAIPTAEADAGRNAGSTPEPDDPTAPELLSRLASDIGEETVEWLWPGVLTFGSVAVLDGHPGVGKSTLAIDIAARLSRGEEMPGARGADSDLTPQRPSRGGKGEHTAAIDALTRNAPTTFLSSTPRGTDGGGIPPVPRSVMIVSAEDHTSRTIRPRLRLAGADMKRIRIVDEVRIRSGPNAGSRPVQLPDDLALLEKKMIADGTRLLILDPLMAFMGCDRRGRRIDAHKDQSVRELLVQLKGLAERTGACILVIRHLSKGVSRSALLRGAGSIGITAAARTVLLAGRHPDQPMLRALAGVKINLGPLPTTLTYRVIGVAGGSRIEWADDCDLGADDLLRPTDNESKKPSRQREAEAFLKDLLKDGAVVSAEEGTRRAKECGLVGATVDRAAKELGVDRFKKGKVWFWSYNPPQFPPLPMMPRL